MFIKRTLIDIFHNRASAVLSSNADNIISNLGIFLEFMDNNVFFRSILLGAEGDGFPDFTLIRAEIQQSRRIRLPTNMLETFRVCMSALYFIIDGNAEAHQIVTGVSALRNIDDMTSEFVDYFFKPVHRYIIEQLIQSDGLLYLIIRFKAFTEWYKKEEFFKEYQSCTQRGESILDQKFREYLFQSGIDYPLSEPTSPEGKTDILTFIEHNPIPVEVKIFSGDRDHIRRGFRQVLRYSRDYNSQIGYLVIFNIMDKELIFRFKEDGFPQKIILEGKTMFVITININPNLQPASRREFEPYEIYEDYLTARD